MPATEIFQTLIKQFELTTPLEWFGTVTGFLCVYLAARQHILNWPISILSVGAYMLLFYENGLYGDAVLQLYFLTTGIYGWYYWLKRTRDDEKPVIRFNGRQLALSLAAVAILSAILGYFLDSYTDSTVPYIDAACTATSFVAQFLMTRKILQNWILWIIVDLAYIPLYIYKDLTLTAVLYGVFTIIAFMGYVDWKRSWKSNL